MSNLTLTNLSQGQHVFVVPCEAARSRLARQKFVEARAVAKSRRALHASALNLVARGSIVSSAMASTFESPDARKEEFRRYLERSGVIDALTKVLVGLYEEPEKPAQALDFIKMTLGAPTGVDVEALKAENEQLSKKVDELTLKLEETTTKLAELEGGGD